MLDASCGLYKVPVMMRFVLAALFTSLLLPLSASAQSEELDAAIDAYRAEDYSHVDVIARYAEDGAPQAIALLGQAYLYGYGLEQDQPLGVALLEQAAGLGERSSTIHLGRVFEFGLEGIPADPETAAKWYVMAARAGDTQSAPAALRRLSRDIVIAAGGTAWANDRETIADNKDAAPNRSVAQETISPASALLGTANVPAPLAMKDGSSFPILADTRLNRIGDASASCVAVLRPEIERQKLAMEDLMKLDGFGASVTTGSRHTELAESDQRVASMTQALNASEAVLNDPRRNGGLGADEVRTALLVHTEALEKRPNSAPAASLCASRIIPLIGESAAWPQP